eukprot:933289-Pleurochrysis_carterae.AAC.1
MSRTRVRARARAVATARRKAHPFARAREICARKRPILARNVSRPVARSVQTGVARLVRFPARVANPPLRTAARAAAFGAPACHHPHGSCACCALVTGLTNLEMRTNSQMRACDGAERARLPHLRLRPSLQTFPPSVRLRPPLCSPCLYRSWSYARLSRHSLPFPPPSHSHALPPPFCAHLPQSPPHALSSAVLPPLPALAALPRALPPLEGAHAQARCSTVQARAPTCSHRPASDHSAQHQ